MHIELSDKRTICRSCGSKDLRLVYDFGPQPLAGEFPLEPESQIPARHYRLDLTQCYACGLLQVTELPCINDVFHADYRYSSSTVPALIEHFATYADWLEQHLESTAKILEFGCNDGVLLQFLSKKGFEVTGIDASDNVAEMARAKGLRVHTGFMSVDIIEDINLNGQVDLITCSNVFAHIDELNPVIEAVSYALRPKGLFSLEVHDGEALVQELQFDTIYHEHLTYYTEKTLGRMLEAAGFAILSCDKTSMHGGGLRMLCRWENQRQNQISPLNNDELVNGLGFSEIIARTAADIRAEVDKCGLLDAFGAAGRTQIFINVTGTKDCFKQVFDNSPLRQGRFIVGTDIPIVQFKGEGSDLCVILAWNYAETISLRVGEHFGKIITVLPELKEW